MSGEYTKDDLMDMLREMAGINNPGEKFLCPQCKRELTRVSYGQAFDFQKMFYCTNKECKKYGLVTVVAIRQK